MVPSVNADAQSDATCMAGPGALYVGPSPQHGEPHYNAAPVHTKPQNKSTVILATWGSIVGPVRSEFRPRGHQQRRNATALGRRRPRTVARHLCCCCRRCRRPSCEALRTLPALVGGWAGSGAARGVRGCVLRVRGRGVPARGRCVLCRPCCCCCRCWWCCCCNWRGQDLECLAHVAAMLWLQCRGEGRQFKQELTS